MNISSLTNISGPSVYVNYGNNSNYTSPLSGPGFVVFNVILLLAVVIPMVVLNGAILLALLLESSTAKAVRLVLGSILVSCLIVALGLAMYHISGLILNLAPMDNPTNIPCTITVFLLGFGGAVRLLSMAAFAVTVYTVVKYHTATTLRVLVTVFIVMVVLWIVSFLGSSPLLSAYVVECTYTDSLSCGPKPTNLSSYIYVGLYVFVFGLGSFMITITFLVSTVCYIKRHTISDEEVKKAMLKFGFFLLIGNGINLLGSTIPPFIAAFIVPPDIVDVDEVDTAFAEVIYLAYILLNASLIPTPVLVPIYFKPIRKKLCHWLCCFVMKRKEQRTRKGSVAFSSSRATEVVSTEM